jgi:D-amino peptidase
MRAAGLAGLLLGASVPAHAQSAGKRIFISVDMEGITGTVTPREISGEGADYQRYRSIMTQEVVAAIAGAREAGATEFVIADAHGDMQNLILEDLPQDVRVVTGTERPLSMMEGIQHGHFDGAMFIGYHASASAMSGVRAHTFASARLSEVKLNGVNASEGYINAAIAAQYGTPVILATGDDVAVAELVPTIGGAETVAVKTAIGFHAAETMMPAAAQAKIKAAAKRAVERIGQIKPAKIAAPAVLDVTFHYYRPAELLAWLPGVERTGSRSIRFQGKDIATAMRLLEFMLSYNVELTP